MIPAFINRPAYLLNGIVVTPGRCRAEGPKKPRIEVRGGPQFMVMGARNSDFSPAGLPRLPLLRISA